MSTHEWFFLIYPFGANISFAARSFLLHLPYIVLFIIFNLLLVSSTNPLLKSLQIELSTASISFNNPFAKDDNSLISIFIYFSTNI